MKITCRDNGCSRVSVRPSIEKSVEEFNKINLIEETPARANLFYVSTSEVLLEEKRQRIFHGLAYRLIYFT